MTIILSSGGGGRDDDEDRGRRDGVIFCEPQGAKQNNAINHHHLKTCPLSLSILKLTFSLIFTITITMVMIMMIMMIMMITKGWSWSRRSSRSSGMSSCCRWTWRAPQPVEGNLEDDDENVKMMNMLMMNMTIIITIRMLTVSHQVVPIYPPLSSAKLEGLHEGAKLNQVIIINTIMIIMFNIIIITMIDFLIRPLLSNIRETWSRLIVRWTLPPKPSSSSSPLSLPSTPGRHDSLDLRGRLHPRGWVPSMAGGWRDTGEDRHNFCHEAPPPKSGTSLLLTLS